MDENNEGPGFEMLRPRPTYSVEAGVSIADLVPDAGWFCDSLQRYCVPGCCGLDAHNFSRESIRWACGFGEDSPKGNDWRADTPGDPLELAADLTATAATVRALDAEQVDASLFCDPLPPGAYADLFEDLAAKLSTCGP